MPRIIWTDPNGFEHGMTVPEDCAEKHLGELREAGMTGMHLAGAPMPESAPRSITFQELVTALANLEWLVRNPRSDDDVDLTFDPETLTVVRGGGFWIESLFDPER